MSWTAENPWLADIAALHPYAQKILINARTVARMGIRDRDRISVESSVGKVIGVAKVTECLHPEAVGMSSHYGTLARGKSVPTVRASTSTGWFLFTRTP